MSHPQHKSGSRLTPNYRLKLESDCSPGPGRYYIKEDLKTGVKFPKAIRKPLFQSEETPAPGLYSIKSIFDSKQSFSFSPKLSKSIPKYPGPADYDVKEIVTNSVRPVIGKEKRKDNFTNTQLVSIPGPGQYNFRHTLVEGPQWRFGSQPSRKAQEIIESPGPGAYEIPDTKSNFFFKFPSGRGTGKNWVAPGPGSYETQSTIRYGKFGICKSEKYQKLYGPIGPGPGDYSYSISSFRVMGSSKSILVSDLGVINNK